ncbi:MAG: PEP-CTERM system TPR-repeat protein PrsT [Sphingomonadales bacterium]|nr:PEP-CTERM system TPR-repeat protein PrsT [Sphingomonadales bacterium]
MTRYLTGSIKTIGLALGLTAASLFLPSAAYAVDAEKSTSHLEEAKKFIAENEWQAAFIELRNAVKANPANVEARTLLADIYLRGGNGVAAQTEIESIRDSGVSRNETALMMAKALYLQRLFADAMAELDESVIPPDELAESLVLKGDIAILELDTEQAITYYTEAEAIDANNVAAKMGLTRALMRKPDVAAAEIKADEAIGVDPNNSMAHALRGVIYRAKGDNEAALSAFSTAVDLNESNLAALIDRTATLLDLRRVEEAQVDIDTIYRQSPDNPMGHYFSAIILARNLDFEGANSKLTEIGDRLDNYLPAVLLKGLVAYGMNNLEQATAHLSRVVSIVPNHLTARRVYAAALLRKGDARSAVDVIEPMVEGGIEDFRLYAILGTAKMQLGDFEGGTQEFERALELEPERTALKAQLALGEFALGETDKAVRDLENIVADDPEERRAPIVLALIALREGRYETALNTSEELIERIPENPIGFNLKGVSLLNLDRLPEAREAFEEAIKLSPGYHSARSNLARVALREGNQGEAELLYREIIEKDENNSRAMVALAQLQVSNEQFDDAIRWIERASVISPNSVPYRLLLVDTYNRAGDVESALDAARAADREIPDSPLLMLALANLQMRQDLFSEAAAIYGRLAREYPENIAYQQLLGRALWGAGDVDDAREVYLSALRGEEGDKWGILNDLLQLERQQQDYERAIAYALELKKNFPDAEFSDAFLGNLYLQAGRFEEAVTSFEAAKDQTDTMGLMIGLYQSYRGAGDYEKALSSLGEWLERNPDASDARRLLADGYVGVSRYPDAAAEYEKILEGEPDNAVVLNNLAWAYHQMKDPKAEATAQRAYTVAPDTPQIADTLGWIKVDSGSNVSEGLLLIQLAARELPEDAQVRYHLGAALYKNGRSDDAREHLRSAVDSGQDFDGIEEARRILREIAGQ